ncbi:hypothetical protein ACJV1Z_01430 [Klebsiella pneumoniae]|uniref:hypothetical protein n=1 Tax=Klebsiella pneumoniae TaxID=573 RepID=UPI000E059173|nr:hypothetical protein [Klebsiella pneumoniae]MCA4071988.1 hypothetical protein [Klebsiella pneumoniae]STT25730.1 Uncharacterised protein [Klebsiella pneumoniae]SWX48349.1 Uncharacterised protein [Klebsiella pneumoniae]HBR7843911.1 hypothetical protein [Klebsiella pneumoniae]HBR7854934.1 hypothetical protein [Klebsiella pneumoniae]
MKKEKFKITEWVAAITLTIGLYCYLYNYIYWRYFGINAYDYFSYIDSLQRSVPLLTFALSAVYAVFIVIFVVLLLIKKRALRFFRFFKSLYKEVCSYHYFVLSVIALIVFYLSSLLVMPILKMESLSYEQKNLAIGALYVIFVAFFSSAISLYAFVRNIERKRKLKNGLYLFFISPIPFQIIMSIFYMPITSAYRDENTIQAQVVTKNGNTYSSHKMLALTKDFVFIVDNKNVIVRKTSDIEYIYYRVDQVK